MHTTIALAKQVVGEVFTVAGCLCLSPGDQAVVRLAAAVRHHGGSGVGNFTTVSPAIYLSGARQNVCSSASAVLATTDVRCGGGDAVGLGVDGYRQNLMYHRDAFAFVTADLPLMADAASCVRKNKDGLSLRVWKGSDIRNDELLMRIDILYGWKALRPEWACRITN
jgi:hypothetical protein